MSFQTCISFFLMLNTKEDSLKYFEDRNSCWSPLTSTAGKEMPWKSILVTSILQNVFIYFQQKKKLIQVWNDMSKWWQNVHFGVYYPFKLNMTRVSCEPHVPVAQWLEHCVSSAKVVGSIPREHILTKKCITWMHCKSLWIKASDKFKFKFKHDGWKLKYLYMWFVKNVCIVFC